MRIAFFLSLAFIAYAYLLFPLIVLVRSLLVRRTATTGGETDSKNPQAEDDVAPFVSVIVACYNEDQSIADKLETVLAADYPRDRLEILVASDGSTDKTEEVVSAFVGRGVQLFSFPRRGKAPALNDTVAASKGEILVFSDANSAFDRGALRALVAPFADPTVGGVAGNQCYTKGQAGDDGVGERSYWSFDRWLKVVESDGGNTISATGAIYAIRREAFRTVPEGVTDDFVTSTRVIEQGYRLVFAPEAIAREPVADSDGAEFRRKVRVMTRGLRAVFMMRTLLNPFKYGFYSIQLLSHKVLRRLVFVPQIVLLVVAPLLFNEGLLYQLATVGQAVFYGLSLLGYWLKRKRLECPRPLSIAAYFCMVNLASAVAWSNLLRGRSIALWETQRAVEGPIVAEEEAGQAVRSVSGQGR